MDPHQLVPGPLEKAVDGRQGPGARDDDALDLRRYAHLLAGVVDDHPRRLLRAGFPGRSPLRRVGGGRRGPGEAQKQQQNGNIKGFVFERSQTLGMNGEKCDFCFMNVKGKNR